MKNVLSVKEKATFGTIGSLKSAYRHGFTRGLALGLILLAAFIVLSGGLLYGEGVVDALFIDKEGNVGIGTNQPQPGSRLDVRGTVKVQELEVAGKTNLVDAVTIEGLAKFKNNLTVNGNVDIGTNDQKGKLEVKGATHLGDNLTVGGATALKNNLTVNGNVGIGSNDAKFKLDVNGDTKLNGPVGINRAPIQTQHLVIQPKKDHIPFNVTDPGNKTHWLTVTKNGNVIMNGGNVGIGTDHPKVPLHIKGPSKSAYPPKRGNKISSQRYGLFIEGWGAAIGWGTYSDVRVKRNPLQVKTASALKTLDSLKVYDYGFIPEYDDSPNRKERGFLAQQVKEVIPGAASVIGDKKLNNGKVLKNFHVLNESRILAETVAAVQELHKIIMAQQKELARLRGEIAATRAQMVQFEDLFQKDGLILTARGRR